MSHRVIATAYFEDLELLRISTLRPHELAFTDSEVFELEFFADEALMIGALPCYSGAWEADALFQFVMRDVMGDLVTLVEALLQEKGCPVPQRAGPAGRAAPNGVSTLVGGGGRCPLMLLGAGRKVRHRYNLRQEYERARAEG